MTFEEDLIKEIEDQLGDCIHSLANYRRLQIRSGDKVGAEVTSNEIENIEKLLNKLRKVETTHSVQLSILKNKFS